jgi:hypothetical protein
MKGIHPKRSSSSFLLDTRPSYHQVRYSSQLGLFSFKVPPTQQISLAFFPAEILYPVLERLEVCRFLSYATHFALSRRTLK